MTNRRQFLTGVCAGLGVAALPQVARATGPCQYKLLEIFIYGAMSHRETLWVEQGAFAPWRQEPNMGSIDAAAAGATSIPFMNSGQQGLPYNLSVGAGFAPFVGTQLLERMRLVSMYGETAVHPVETCVKLTGASIGRGAASTGAHIESHFASDAAPTSYVIDANLLIDNVRFATATNADAVRRPFVLPLGSDAFVEKLERSGVVTDTLVDLYRDRYNQLLHHDTGRVRSPAFDAYSDSLDRSIHWQQVYGLLAGIPTLEAPGPSIGGVPNFLNNRMVLAIEIATYLFENGARHVLILGGGDNAHPSVDTHDSFPNQDYVGHATHQNGVLYGITKALRNQFDLGRLPLSQILVSIGSEFGRYGDGNNGTEHRASGFAHALIGGPITARGVAGNLDFVADNKGKAQGGFHASQLNASLCIAAGVDPTRFGSPAATSALTTSVLGVDPTTLTCDIGDIEGL